MGKFGSHHIVKKTRRHMVAMLFLTNKIAILVWQSQEMINNK